MEFEDLLVTKGNWGLAAAWERIETARRRVRSDSAHTLDALWKAHFEESLLPWSERDRERYARFREPDYLEHMDYLHFGELLHALAAVGVAGKRILELGGFTWGYEIYFAKENYLNASREAKDALSRLQYQCDLSEPQSWNAIEERLGGRPERIIAQRVFESDCRVEAHQLSQIFESACDRLDPGGILVVFNVNTGEQGFDVFARAADLEGWQGRRIRYEELGRMVLVLCKPDSGGVRCPVSRIESKTGAEMKNALLMLGQLSDEDVEWMAQVGDVRRIPTGMVLIEQGTVDDTLQVVLSGSLSVFVRALGQTEIDRMGRGEIFGEVSILDSHPASATVKVHEESVVLAVSRAQLDSRLLEDPGFSGRFYKAIALFLAHRLRQRDRWRDHVEGKTSDGEKEGEGDSLELGAEVLEHLHLAGARFERLLERLERL